MSKIQKLFLTIGAVVIIGGAFYWFEIRPSEIRKTCANLALPDAAVSKELYWNSYRFCLADRGLKE